MNVPLPLRSLTRDEVRDVDRRAVDEYGIVGLVLMENAGRGAAELLAGLGIGGSVVICAGKGNNGGDGFVMARRLDYLGFETRVLLFADPGALTGDAAVNYRVLEAAGLAGRVFHDPVTIAEVETELSAADWIVDGLLGTGTRSTIREPFVSVIGAINRSGKKVFAVDLPSGMDCDTGQPLGACVRAHGTATFVSRKIGFDRPGADQWTGAVHVIDIGVPRRLLMDYVHS